MCQVTHTHTQALLLRAWDKFDECSKEDAELEHRVMVRDIISQHDALDLSMPRQERVAAFDDAVEGCAQFVGIFTCTLDIQPLSDKDFIPEKSRPATPRSNPLRISSSSDDTPADKA